MILTPIPLLDLPATLDRFDQGLAEHPLAQTVFRRIAASLAVVDGDDLSLSQDPAYHHQAVALLREFDMGVIDEPPTAGFTWDGYSVRVRMEPSVIIHEVAHLQLCARERRTVWDFGLGAGPETGRREDADRVMSVFGLEREMEESLTSLLGILWEAELGQPAILAFLEQNWLEGYDRPHNRQHFLKVVGALARHGFLDDEGRPTRALREIGDDEFLHPLVTP
ncbi:MAG TPA: hypothetical protein VK558_00420 [Patescibacteria group bacterium]|nr:hypothetical protein [Patescibacteria group bacterium]